jgi:hypothetical protein
MKPDINGAAALIQGYVALEGFGITLIKNQRVEPIPSKINKILPLKLLISDILLKKIINQRRKCL